MPTKQKSGLYRAKVKIGDDWNGKPIYKYISGKTKRELELNRQRTIAHYITGETNAKDQLFGTYVISWYEAFKKPRLSPGTDAEYRSIFNRWILPELAERNIRSISSTDIQRLLNTTNTTGVRVVEQLLTQVFNHAIADKIITTSPMLNCSAPTSCPKEKRVLTSEERKAYIAYAQTSKHRVLYLLQYYLGTRVGETLGLKWGDIDWDAGMVHIQRDLDPVTQDFGAVKTKSSDRLVPLPNQLRDVLYPIRQHPDARITLEHTNTAYVAFQRMRDVIGIPEFTSHWLRHNYISMCWENGIDVYATARFAGHANVKVTMDVYTHLSQLAERANADKVRNMFG